MSVQAGRWRERGEAAKARLVVARSQHTSLQLGWRLYEEDSAIGGGLLAGALAYRLFVLLLPTALLLVSGLGLYAGAVDQTTRQVAREAGLHGLFASNVGATAAGGARWLVFLLMVPVVVYAAAKLYGALAVVNGRRSCRARSSSGWVCWPSTSSTSTSRPAWSRTAHTYGALGIATALLFSLVLVGRLAVVSAELNAVLVRRGAQV